MQPQDPNSRNKPFESDTQKIIHRHLSDPNDEITEQDIASVRIGMTPPESEIVTEETARETAEKLNDENADDVPAEDDRKTSPWDIMEE